MVDGSALMLWQPRKLAARDVARDFAVSAQVFADTFVQYIASEEMARDAQTLAQRRRETCAAVWAAILATFDASGFNAADCELVLPLVREALLPFWHKHCGCEAGIGELLDTRAAHYLSHRDPASQLKTAMHIVNGLMHALGDDGKHLMPVRTLTAILAHRMLSDQRRLDELKATCSIG